MLFLILAIAGCNISQEPFTSETPSPEPSVAESATIGLKNGRQLTMSLSLLTEIGIANPAISSYYRNAQTRFSTDGRVESLSASSLLTSTAIASLFCDRLLRNEVTLPPERRRFFKDVNLFSGISKFSTMQRRHVIQIQSGMFWQRLATEEEVMILLGMMEEVGQGETSKKTLYEVLLSTCTVMASSVEALTL